MNILEWLTDSSVFMPRGDCGPGWTQRLQVVHQFSELAIAFAYVLIPAQLWVFYVKRQRRFHDVARPFTLWLVCASVFIFSCGMTHVMSRLMFDYPMYRLAGLVLGITAITSLGTMLAMPFLGEAALRVPSATLLSRLNKDLEVEVETRRKAVHELKNKVMVLQAQLEEAREVRRAIDRVPTTKLIAKLDSMISQIEREIEKSQADVEEFREDDRGTTDGGEGKPREA